MRELPRCFQTIPAGRSMTEPKPVATISSKSALSYIGTYKKGLSRRDLANLLNVGERKLSRLFNEGLGKSLPAYINSVRMKEAATLLRKPEIENIGDL